LSRRRLAPEADRARIADLDRAIADAHLRLGDRQRAHEAAVQALDADPLSAQAYRQLAALLLAQGRADEAAVTLVQGVIVTADMGLRDELLDLYKQGLDREGCAILPRGAYERAINPACGIVRRHACSAIPAALRLYARMNRRDLVEQVKTIARRDFACPLGEIPPDTP
jgi:tetratricopeptide (TPR) repeat protein